MRLLLVLIILSYGKYPSYGQQKNSQRIDSNCVRVSITISGAGSVCQKGSIQFAANIAGGVWGISSTNIGKIDKNGLFVTGSRTGSAIISYIVTNSNGCKDTGYKQVTVLPRPSAGSISGSNSVCRGSSVKFTASVTGGRWVSTGMSTLGTIDQNGLFMTATRTGTTKILYIASNTQGCSDTAVKSLTINEKPSAGKISGNSSVCMGSSTPLVSSTTGGSWITSNNNIGTISKTGLFTGGTIAGSVNVLYIITNSSGCKDTAIKPMLVLSKAVAGTIYGDNAVCVGGSLLFTSSKTGGNWSSINNPSVGNINQKGVFITGTTSGSATILYTMINSNGCNDTAFKGITINPKPNAGIIAGDSAVCKDDTVLYTSTTAGGLWSTNNTVPLGTINQNGVFISGHITGSTFIGYSVQNNFGCTDSTAKWIVIQNCPGSRKHTARAMKENVKTDIHLTAFPNPSRNGFTIKSGSNNEKLIIRDYSGRVIQQFIPITSKNISFGENYKPGYYFLEITDMHRSRTIQLLKMP